MSRPNPSTLGPCRDCGGPPDGWRPSGLCPTCDTIKEACHNIVRARLDAIERTLRDLEETGILPHAQATKKAASNLYLSFHGEAL